MENFEKITAQQIIRRIELNNTMIKYCIDNNLDDDLTNYTIANLELYRLSKSLFNIEKFDDKIIYNELQTIANI
jgi:hypothetical protein